MACLIFSGSLPGVVVTKTEFRKLLEKHGICYRPFIEEAWTRMGGFANVLTKKEFEPVIRLFMKRIPKKRKEELGRR